MERLTVMGKNGKWALSDKGWEDKRLVGKLEKIPIATARLAAYENTGLTPDEVLAMKIVLLGCELAKITDIEGVSINRIIELAEAEKKGLLKILPPNDPLTLEELREMAGEPVFVSVSRNWRDSGISDGWRLVRFHKSDDRVRCCIYDTHSGVNFCAEQDYGISWWAYRRRPEEGTE